MKRLQFLAFLLLLGFSAACQPASTPAPTASETPVPWQDLPWSWTPLTGSGPAPVRAMQAVYDENRQSILLFGGLSDQPLAETWQFTSAGWQRLRTSATPPARFWHGMAYDPNRQLTYLFGGTASDTYGDNLNDTWQYDGSNWIRVATAHTPSPRGRGALLIYDSCRQKLVLFGGQTANTLPNSTWEFDGTEWNERILPASPPGRFLSGMVFDPQRCVTVLFGGGGAELGAYDDTWEYDGASWTPVQTAHAPSGRWAHAMAYEPATGTVLLYGGYDPLQNRMNSDTWRFDGKDWQPVDVQDSAGQMEQASLAWDGANGRMLLIGFGSTWSLTVAGAATAEPAWNPTHTPQPVQPTASRTSTRTPTRTATPTVARTPGCDSGFSRLQAGMTAILTAGGPPNRVRSEPLLDEVNIVSLLYSNATVTVLGGPVCRDGLVFWKVASSTIPGGEGWTAEGDGTVYYMEPYQP